MERKIGDQFDYNSVTLEVAQVENFSCKGCYFYNTNINCKPQNVRDHIGHCTESYREDKKIVIFKEIK